MFPPNGASSQKECSPVNYGILLVFRRMCWSGNVDQDASEWTEPLQELGGGVKERAIASVPLNLQKFVQTQLIKERSLWREHTWTGDFNQSWPSVRSKVSRRQQNGLIAFISTASTATPASHLEYVERNVSLLRLIGLSRSVGTFSVAS